GRSRVTAGMVSQAVEEGAPIGPKSYRGPGPQRSFDRNIARRFLLQHASFFSVQTGRSAPYEMIDIRSVDTPREAREFIVLLARRSPRARLYSGVPRSSQWPSIRTSCSGCSRSQVALVSSVCASPGLISALSKSKWIRVSAGFGAKSFGGGSGAAVATCTGAGAAAGGGAGVSITVVCVSVTVATFGAGGGAGAGAEAAVGVGRLGRAATHATAKRGTRTAVGREHARTGS